MRWVLPVFLALLPSMGGVLFTDDFNDGNDDGWTREGAAEFQVISQEYVIYSQGDRGLGKSLNGDLNGVMSTPDYSVLGSVTMETGLHAGLLCRWIDSSQWYYRLVMRPASGSIALERLIDSGPTMVLDESPVQIFLNTEYLVRLEVEGDEVRGRIWTGSQEDEPQEWDVSVTDGLQGQAGSFGVFGAGFGKVSWSMIFDDITVSTPLPESLRGSSWAGIKAVEF